MRDLSFLGEDFWFKINRESWNIYLLDDGSTLRIRYVLAKVVRTGQFDAAGSPVYGLASQNVMSVRSAKELRGTPSTDVISPEGIAQAESVEVKVKQTVSEDWNEYLLDDGTVLGVKLVVTKISRTNLFDRAGDPVYSVHSQSLLRTDVPKELRKGIQKIKPSTER